MQGRDDRHRIGCAWLAVLLLMLTCPVVSQAAEGLDFLKKVQSAASTLDYAGIYVYQQGATIQTSRIIHIVDGKGERERLEVLDGAPRECLREQDTQQCLQPERKLVVVQHARSDHFPALLLGNERAITDHYAWRPVEGNFRVAGRDCAVSELSARDHLRYSYRICTDLETHLLLRSQTLDPDGQLVDQTSFGSLALGKDVSPDAIDSPWDTRNWKQHAEHSNPVDLGARGWRFALPPGFQPVAEIARQIRPGHAVDQLVLSDGLAAISLFIETFDPDRDQSFTQGGTQQGAVNIYRIRLASYWLTAVGEVPAQTVRDIAEAAQFVPRAAR